MRVGLLNVRFSPNLGDGLLAECMERELAALPGVSKVVSVDLAGRSAYGDGLQNRQLAMRVLGAMPRPVRRFAAAAMLKLLVARKLRPAWREALEGLDVLVLGGGNLIADHDLNFPIKISAAVELAAAKKLPVAVFGVGVSEDWSPAAQAYLARAFGKVRVFHVAVRDQKSQALWRDRFAYPALVCRDPGVLASRHYARRPGDGGVVRVGLGLTDPMAVSYHGGDAIGEAEFTAWCVELARGLDGRGCEVTLFTNGSPEDRAYLQRAAEAIRAEVPRVQVAPGFRDPGELAAFASGLDLLLAHRLHACIVAYSFGVPHVGFLWDEKVRSFFGAVGRSRFLADAGRDPPEAVLQLCDEALRVGVDESRRAAILAEARQDIARLHEAIQREAAAA